MLVAKSTQITPSRASIDNMAEKVAGRLIMRMIRNFIKSYPCKGCPITF
jgi:hypothetical protein